MTDSVSWWQAVPCVIPNSGRRSDGPAQAVHARGDGAGADGAQPVQGAADGAAGGRAVDRDDQGVARTPWRAAQQEEVVHLELVSTSTGLFIIVHVYGFCLFTFVW